MLPTPPVRDRLVCLVGLLPITAVTTAAIASVQWIESALLILALVLGTDRTGEKDTKVWRYCMSFLYHRKYEMGSAAEPARYGSVTRLRIADGMPGLLSRRSQAMASCSSSSRTWRGRQQRRAFAGMVASTWSSRSGSMDPTAVGALWS